MIQSLGDLVRRNARFFPEDAATVFQGRRTTNIDLLHQAEALGASLLAAGCQRQDRVALLGMNSDRYWEAMAGCWLSGLIVATVNFRLATPEIQHILNDTQPHVLLFEAAYAPAIASIRQQLSVRHYVCLDGDVGDWAIPYGAFIAGCRAPLANQQVHTDEIATLLYTSGTTGRPKGVMRSHLAELTLGEQMAMMFDFRTGGRSLVVMPLFHAGAQSSSYAQMWRCGTLFIQRGFEPEAVLDIVAADHITNLHFVPQMLQAMLDAAEARDAAGRTVDTSSVETIAYAAAPMSPALLRRALARFGPVFVNGWGMSEGNGTSLPKHKHALEGTDAALLSSIGQPNAKAEMRIVATDDTGLDRDCAPGETGELWLRSASVMTGYWNNSAATIEALRDGWLRTGDLGYADAAGNIFLVDRKKDMIISGGENIYSQEVERAVAEHPDVASVAVIGVPDPKWGETVMAIIVPKAGTAPTADAIITHSQTLIASYKKPRHVVFVPALPLLPSGKVDKISLRRQYATAPL
ncbi:class I adenylate-forming enzyme family protein [Nitrospirillum viridazoti]|uniref:3-methylmercaptopropionyl-CoA ligase n=1 Tax=Nitrospirillum viridazoti CBAmc TaxID=1441467 RepID=A0A248JU45_9PROT|nr:AMP-binding protein [Nitrospirillum amazonense]ASG22225.1 AMP-dependent synthetase [Nitrospirillum amazonense CBAmc]TWB31010.1 acyl-CoA synthetase (AMP-forming)/AMP-acid ligase II [Nitrospirillum amazonense]